MNRIDRLFGILILLQSKKHVPAEKIADKFEISVRTIYRDVKALCELGVPVSFEATKGYYVMQGYFQPPVSFSSEEAHALLLAESMVYGFGDKSIQQHYSAALVKVKTVLRSSQKDKIELLSNSTRMQRPEWMNHDFGFISTIQQAIATRMMLDLHYKNNADKISIRKCEPIGLVFYAFNWHLIAWCHERKDYRDFRLSRIQKLSCLEKPFLKTDHMELNEYMKQIPVNF